MSGEKAPRKQSFLQGVAVLTAATIIVKLLGFIYKVPLQNILQERGFGYFNTAYDVYNVLLMISTTGLPVAVSRMISQAQALENYAQIRKIYSVSMKVFLTIGVIGTLVMLVFCKQYDEHGFARHLGHRGAVAVRAAHLHRLGPPGLLPGPEQHDPDLRQSGL